MTDLSVIKGVLKQKNKQSLHTEIVIIKTGNHFFQQTNKQKISFDHR